MSDDHDHEHYHPISINPSELSSGSVLVHTEDLADANDVHVATSRAVIGAISHDGDEKALHMLSPIELVLAGLARSTLQTLRLVVTIHGLQLNKLFIAVSQKAEGGKTVITREVIIEGVASDEEREMLKEMAEKCPVSQMLSGASIQVDTVVV